MRMRLFNQIPRLIRWILGVMLVFLLFMTLYRFVFFFHYRGINRPFSGSAFILGLRYDARIISVMGLAMLLLCAIPWLNPFRYPSAKKVWIVLAALSFMTLLFFYGADF